MHITRRHPRSSGSTAEKSIFCIFRYSIVALCFLATFTPTSTGLDLFSYLALPDWPLGQMAPPFVASASSLRLSWTSEEIYRRRVGGLEMQRFDGHRTNADAEIALLPHLSIGAGFAPSARQTWLNDDPDKGSRFAFVSHEARKSLLARLHGTDWAAQWSVSHTNDLYEGSFELADNVVAALGENPPIRMSSPSTSHEINLWGRKGRIAATHRIAWQEIGHLVESDTLTMNVRIPLDRSLRTRSTELSWTPRQHPWRPFLRYEDVTDAGDGTSTKNDRFIFGSTRSVFSGHHLALGLERFGPRTSWFGEWSQGRYGGHGAADNNLITLNPLLLFGTNEVDVFQSLDPIRPWGIRLGWRRLWRNTWEGRVQYGLQRFDLGRTTVQTSISRMRTVTETSQDRSVDRLRLHRLDLQLKRPDSGGAWKIGLRLMAPQALEKTSKEKAAAGGGGGGPVSPGTTVAKPSEEVRGGWQFTLVRELRW